MNLVLAMTMMLPSGITDQTKRVPDLAPRIVAALMSHLAHTPCATRHALKPCIKIKT